MPRLFLVRRVALAALAVALVHPARVGAEPGDIHGQTVKGDKSKSANDGWSQAPVPREQSAGKDAPNPGGESTEQNASRPVSPAGDTDNGADDPSKPMEHRAPGPSGTNPAQPTK